MLVVFPFFIDGNGETLRFDPLAGLLPGIPVVVRRFKPSVILSSYLLGKKVPFAKCGIEEFLHIREAADKKGLILWRPNSFI